MRGMMAGTPSLRWYIVGRMFYALSFASYSYFAVYLIDKFGLDTSAAGTFTIVIAATFVVVNPLLGFLADKRGHLINHVIAMLCIVGANLIALLSPWYPLSIFCIALGAVTHTAIAVSGFALPMEFGEDHEIPIFIATVGVFVGAVSVGILFLGIAGERWGYPLIFWICGAGGLIAAAIFSRKVTEPRNRVPPPVHDVR
jgi:predicted MFS family arabinose efflux permease